MLITVRDYQEVAQRVNALLLQGGVTNGLPDRDRLEREIAQGTLVMQEDERGLLLLRKREKWDHLSFFLRKGQSLCGWKPERSTVVELPFRREGDPMGTPAEELREMGFRLILRRCRYTRKGRADITYPERDAANLDESYSLLCSSFSPLTGCLPSREEWDALCKDRQILSVCGGVLHYDRKGKTTELRHLAVAEECRGQGVGRALVGAYLNRCGAELSRVWTGEDNEAARRLYESFGYEKDGWTSRVYYFDMDKKDNKL